MPLENVRNHGIETGHNGHVVEVLVCNQSSNIGDQFVMAVFHINNHLDIILLAPIHDFFQRGNRSIDSADRLQGQIHQLRRMTAADFQIMKTGPSGCVIVYQDGDSIRRELDVEFHQLASVF